MSKIKKKKMQIDWEIPGTSRNVHIFENSKEKAMITNCIFIADADTGEVLYIENVPSSWIKNLIKDSKIRIYNPSERQ